MAIALRGAGTAMPRACVRAAAVLAAMPCPTPYAVRAPMTVRYYAERTLRPRTHTSRLSPSFAHSRRAMLVTWTA